MAKKVLGPFAGKIKFNDFISATASEWNRMIAEIIHLRAENAELRIALRPFAQLYPGGLRNVGGGTLIAPEIKIQWVKDARAAIAKHREK